MLLSAKETPSKTVWPTCSVNCWLMTRWYTEQSCTRWLLARLNSVSQFWRTKCSTKELEEAKIQADSKRRRIACLKRRNTSTERTFVEYKEGRANKRSNPS